MPRKNSRKQQLDKQRTQWRKEHRTLNGRIILYPEKQPEHINARGNKIYNWFWKKILLQAETQEIPAIISALQDHTKNEKNPRTLQLFRTMIGMANDAYQLKKIENIKDYDTELHFDNKSIYNSEEGVIFRDGHIYTTDYTEDESQILIRDIEGIIVDTFSSAPSETKIKQNNNKNNLYKDWEYMEEKSFANK